MSPVDSTERENTIKKVHCRFRRRGLSYIGVGALGGFLSLGVSHPYRNSSLSNHPLVQAYLEAEKDHADLTDFQYKLEKFLWKKDSPLDTNIPPETPALNLLADSLQVNFTSFQKNLQTSRADLQASQKSLQEILASLADRPEVMTYRNYKSLKDNLSDWGMAGVAFFLFFTAVGLSYALHQKEVETKSAFAYPRSTPSI